MNASTYKSGTEPRTVADLLLELQNSDRGFRMQKYAANEIARFFKMQINAIRLEMLQGIDEEFRAYLLGKGWEVKSARGFVSHLRRFVREAVALGWILPTPKWSPEWARVLSVLKRTKGLGSLIKYVVGNRINPEALSNEDLAGFHDEMIAARKTPEYVKEVISSFKDAIRGADLQTEFPCLAFQTFRYGTRLDELPEDLRADLLRLLDLRQLAPEDDEKDRPKKLKQLRKISADTLGRTISQIHGYSVDVLGLPEVSSVKELLREDLVIKYIRWNVNVRELDGDAFYARMQLLYANVKHYSQFADINPTWFIEASSISRVQIRKQRINAESAGKSVSTN